MFSDVMKIVIAIVIKSRRSIILQVSLSLFVRSMKEGFPRGSQTGHGVQAFITEGEVLEDAVHDEFHSLFSEFVEIFSEVFGFFFCLQVYQHFMVFE